MINRASYALMWLLGSMASGLLVLGSAHGPFQPQTRAFDEPPATETLERPTSLDDTCRQGETGSSGGDDCTEDVAEGPTIEALPFRVLGYGDVEVPSLETPSESPECESQSAAVKEVDATDRATSVGLLRGIARSLAAGGNWLNQAADAIERRATATGIDE